MAHTCSTMVLHCMDFRLGSAIRDELARREILDDCDIVAIAGAGKTIVSDDPQSWHEATMSHIVLSKKLHGIKKLLIMNHTDCGAYGGRGAFKNRIEENEKHIADMEAAKVVVSDKHPDLEVELVLVQIDEDGAVRFEDVANV